MTSLEKIQIFLDLQISVGYLFISILIFGIYIIIDDYFKRCEIEKLTSALNEILDYDGPDLWVVEYQRLLDIAEDALNIKRDL